MFVLRTFCTVNMNDLRLWLVAVVLHTAVVTAYGGHHRRSMASQGALSVSKGGWRPVVGSGGFVFGTAPLHAPAYKIPVPVLDSYQHGSSSRPLVARDVAKLTSIAQSYRPTTLRTVQSSSPVINQPINSYHNPFTVQNNGFSSYKYIQNFPVESVLVRNPHNPFATRPVYTKYPTFKQNTLQNAMLQQLTNVQPIQFGQYPTSKPLDPFGKQVEFSRPADLKKPQNHGIEVFKPEVFLLPDSESASQTVLQQVKTAQQQVGSTNPFSQYPIKDSLFPPNILGTFGTFGLQSVKGRDPFYQFQNTKTSYLPPQPLKQTIFNSFKYSPNFKSTQAPISSTTQKNPTTANQIYFGTTYSDFKITPAPQTKVYPPQKIDPNAGTKDRFKPSPQDPFAKHHQSDFNKISVTTYNPLHTTSVNNFHDYSFQQNQHLQNFYDQNFNYDRKKNKVHDSLVAGGNQQSSQQYATAPIKSEAENNGNSQRYTQHTDTHNKPSYEVIETTEPDINTHSSTAPWSLTSQSYDHNNQKTEEESRKKQEYSDTLDRPATTTLSAPEEYAIVTEGEKGYENSFNYESQVDSQSRRPLGDDDFEPIEKHKLKDYYYKISTPSYNEFSTSKRTNKPTAVKTTTTQETTPHFIYNNDNEQTIGEALPTLPPNKHFKRPQPNQELLDKDKIRKRNKIRRRRPPLTNASRFREETSTYKVSSTEPPPTTAADEIYTIRSRIKSTTRSQPNLTTPTVTTDLTTSAVPTISPTIPTIVKKKLTHRRPLTTPAEKVETTTQTYLIQDKESQIMKISSRPQYLKQAFKTNLKTIETADFSHKQDEKDTPTSDIAVSLTDTLKTTESAQEFSFHKDVKPIEAKLEPYKDTTIASTKNYDPTETTAFLHLDTTTEKIQRPRIRNKFNRTRFNVKDYRSRLSSTTGTTEKSVDNTSKTRFPQRRIPYSDNDNENTTERKKFTPKDPRHGLNSGTEINEQIEKEIHSFKNNRQRQTAETVEVTTARISTRIRQRRPRPTEEATETPTSTTAYRRPLRKKITDAETEESENIAVTETTVYDKNEITSERTQSESAIMKIADKKHHQEQFEHLFEHSKRVSDLTLASSKDYNKQGMFKTVASNSRRIPNYFTIATDDPILPIEAFFPQLNQKKES